MTVFTRFLGYPIGGNSVPASPNEFIFSVDSWENEDEIVYDLAEVGLKILKSVNCDVIHFPFLSSSQSIIENSPNRDLEANFDYASLQTLSLPCSASTTFVPIDSEVPPFLSPFLLLSFPLTLFPNNIEIIIIILMIIKY